MRSAHAWRRHTRGGSQLFSVYALISLAPVVVLGVILVRGENHSASERALAQGRAQAAVIVQMAIAPALDGRSVSNGVTSAEVARLHRATNLAVYSGSLTAMRLRDFGGRVVYSDNGSDSDSLSARSPQFRAAARGHTRAAITPSPGSGSGRSIRVLQPVVPNATGQATGVLELYLPYAPIAAALRQEKSETYVRLAAGLAILYLVLAAISWSAHRRLRQYAAKQEHQALHDPLTGLPNREQFRRSAIRAINRSGDGGALVLIDLNRFKAVNDQFGHHAGDELLVQVADRLLASVRTDDHVARLGGDEFGMVLTGVKEHHQAVALVDAVRRNLDDPVEVAGRAMTIEASFGVALFPEHGTDLSQLLVDADQAMYAAKTHVSPVVLFDPLRRADHGVTAMSSTARHLARARG